MLFDNYFQLIVMLTYVLVLLSVAVNWPGNHNEPVSTARSDTGYQRQPFVLSRRNPLPILAANFRGHPGLPNLKLLSHNITVSPFPGKNSDFVPDINPV